MKTSVERKARMWADFAKSQSEEKQRKLNIKFKRLMKGAPTNPKSEPGKFLTENVRTFAVAKIILDALSVEERALVSQEIKKGVDCASLAAALSWEKDAA